MSTCQTVFRRTPMSSLVQKEAIHILVKLPCPIESIEDSRISLALLPLPRIDEIVSKQFAQHCDSHECLTIPPKTNNFKHLPQNDPISMSQSNDPELGKTLYTIQATAVKACSTLPLGQTTLRPHALNSTRRSPPASLARASSRSPLAGAGFLVARTWRESSIAPLTGWLLQREPSFAWVRREPNC